MPRRFVKPSYWFTGAGHRTSERWGNPFGGKHAASARRLGGKRVRRGMVITIATLLVLPILLTLLFLVAEVAHLWQARMQLENALEAAVLAAVQDWGSRGGGRQNLEAAMAAGRAMAEANAVQGAVVRLSEPGSVARAVWTFGTMVPTDHGWRFIPDPDAQGRCAVKLQVAMRTPRLCRAVAGKRLGEVTIAAATAAYFDAGATPPRPRLIRLVANR